MKFEITILGSGSSIPTLERGSTAQLVNLRENYFLVDCGEGTQMQMRKYKVAYSKINHIFISHLHGDHYLGLVGFLSSMSLLGRKTDLTVYANADLKPIIDQHFKISDTRLNFKLHFKALDFDQKEMIYENNYVRVFSFPTKHRVPCCGFYFEEKQRELRLDKEAIKDYKVPVAKMAAIKKGDDFVTADGKIIKNKLLTLPAEKTYSYAFASDTCYSKKVIEAVKGVDVLYHESTFLEDLIDRAKKTFHSTAKQAAKVAVETGAKELYLGHFSVRYGKVEEFAKEAREVFKNSHVVNDGDVIKIY
ncbi:MAG TPA: ribonuclease Z [Flavobacteriales bacterium]|nr:ribonuclease Z [Flavobacteriales bacterium]